MWAKLKTQHLPNLSSPVLRFCTTVFDYLFSPFTIFLARESSKSRDSWFKTNNNKTYKRLFYWFTRRLHSFRCCCSFQNSSPWLHQLVLSSCLISWQWDVVMASLSGCREVYFPVTLQSIAHAWLAPRLHQFRLTFYVSKLDHIWQTSPWLESLFSSDRPN